MIHITPDTMEAAYNLLKTTRPFRAWRLPDADDVSFMVIRKRSVFADYRGDTGNGKHLLRVCHLNVHHLDTLMRTLAHEMCHMREDAIGGRQCRNDVQHGQLFNWLADQVCRHHGFDRGAF